MRTVPRFLANLNVLMVVLLAATWIVSYSLDTPLWSFGPQDGFRAAAVLAALGIMLILFWGRYGLVPRSPGVLRRWLAPLGHAGVALCNVVMVGALLAVVQVFSRNHEDGYWLWLAALDYAPICYAIAALSIELIYVAASRRGVPSDGASGPSAYRTSTSTGARP